jgi:predicted transcriptional regulator
MTKTAVITARIDTETLDALDALAATRERTRAWLVAKAIERFVREESELHAFLKEGEDAIDRGDYLTQDEMTAEIERWKRSRKRAA